MIFDRGITFHFLHKADNAPLRYQKVCTKENTVVPWPEVVKGYEVAKNEYVVFDPAELDAVKPESDKRIHISKFVDYLSVDPVYFSSSYVLLPDKSKEAYSLLLTALESMGKAAAGRITLRPKSTSAGSCLQRRLSIATLRYNYDVSDPSFERSTTQSPEKLNEPRQKKL